LPREGARRSMRCWGIGDGRGCGLLRGVTRPPAGGASGPRRTAGGALPPRSPEPPRGMARTPGFRWGADRSTPGAAGRGWADGARREDGEELLASGLAPGARSPRFSEPRGTARGREGELTPPPPERIAGAEVRGAVERGSETRPGAAALPRGTARAPGSRATDPDGRDTSPLDRIAGAERTPRSGVMRGTLAPFRGTARERPSGATLAGRPASPTWMRRPFDPTRDSPAGRFV